MNACIRMVAVGACVFSQTVWAATNWSQIINENGGSNVFFGVEVDGPDSYSRNADDEFAPASNSKLFTAGAALEKLGEDFRFETSLQWKSIDADRPDSITEVKLIGSGDPSWGMSELGEGLTTRIDAMVLELANQGITDVQGDISVTASDKRWNYLRWPVGWQPDDYVSCYGALAQAFNLNLNCGDYVVTSPTTGHWREDGVPVPVTLKITYGSYTSLYVEPVDSSHAPDAGFVVKGTWKSGSAAEDFALPIHNVTGWVKNLFIKSLAHHGIHYTSKAPPAGFNRSRYELKFNSPTLATILKPFMKNSIDMIGDDLLKTMGSKFDGAGDDLIESGRAIMKDYVSVLGNVADTVQVFDGSGVSRSSRVTPRSLLALLDHLKGLSVFNDLWGALPIAGVDGTLIYRMRGTPAQGFLRAKTGTLNGVYNLSGYVPIYESADTISDYVPFVMLTRTTAAYNSASRAAEDRVGAALAKLLRPTGDLGEMLNLTTQAPYPFIPEHAGLDQP